jgi:hypothetical protein
MTFDVEQGYIRHPDEIPVSVQVSQNPPNSCAQVLDSDFLGISFLSDQDYAKETLLDLMIPVNGSFFETTGIVAWSQPTQTKAYRIGLYFDNAEIAYAVRMIEQICHIEAYRQRVEAEQGRPISQESAAAEWIQTFAHNFPVCAQSM